MKVIVITAPAYLDNEKEVITKLFEAGLSTLHIRKPDFNVDETEQFILSIPSEFHNRIVLHNHYELATIYSLKGLHVKSGHIIGNSSKGTTSISAHSVEQLKLLPYYDYIFLSPVFDSISKNGYKGKFDFGLLAKQLKQIKLLNNNSSVIALGGITAENTEKAIEMGFDGVAALGYLWEYLQETGDVKGTVERFNSIKLKCKQLSHTH